MTVQLNKNSYFIASTDRYLLIKINIIIVYLLGNRLNIFYLRITHSPEHAQFLISKQGSSDSEFTQGPADGTRIMIQDRQIKTIEQDL